MLQRINDLENEDLILGMLFLFSPSVVKLLCQYQLLICFLILKVLQNIKILYQEFVYFASFISLCEKSLLRVEEEVFVVSLGDDG